MKLKYKGAIFFILLFLLVGAVSASEDINETISVENSNDNISNIENEDILEDGINYKDIVITDKPCDYPKITVNDISGYQGDTLTLKAKVTKKDGSISPATVEFNFNGNTYTAKTNSYGVASVTIKFPKSYALKTTSKTKGNILTKTTTYKSTYDCEVTVNGDEYYTSYANFMVISKKSPVVKKYKITKKTKTLTLPVKNGVKTYKKGNYGFITYKHEEDYYNSLEVVGAGKKEGFIKFYVKEHYKQNGKWKWNSWFKVPKGKSSEFKYGFGVKCDKIKVKYTKVTYKRI